MINKVKRIVSVGLALLMIFSCLDTSVYARNKAKNGNQNIMFDEESGLLWPVYGEIALPYSVDRMVYFKTLEKYKINTGLMIESATGTEVRSAAKGTVTRISESEEFGMTVSMNIGNGYKIKYGQLSDVEVHVGDIIEEGTSFAKVAEPTKYYLLEGSHLYLQVLYNGETVDPLEMLR